MKYNTILFDLDGTLIDSNEIILKTFEHVLNKFVPEVEVTRDLLKSFIGPSLLQTFGTYRDSDTVQEMIREYRAYYVLHEAEYHEIYPNVLEVVKQLKEQGYYLGIVTTKYKEAAWPSFTHYGLEPYFDAFVGLEHVTNPKPDREPIDVALKSIPNHTGVLMVGDNKSDIYAGQNAGCKTIGVGWTFKGKDVLALANPDYMIDSMNDIVEILHELNA